MQMQMMLQISGKNSFSDWIVKKTLCCYQSGKQKRSYRNSLEVVKKAAHVWKKSNIEFVAQLGDIIDGRAKYNTSSDIECTKVTICGSSK